MGALQSPFFQVCHQPDIQFPYVEIGQVGTVQVGHIAMGDAVSGSGGQIGVFAAPGEGVLAYQPIIGAVDVLGKHKGKIHREPAAGSPVQFRTVAAAQNAFGEGNGGIQRFAMLRGQVFDSTHKIRFRLTQLVQCQIIKS